ncbi:selenium-dependent molybdenum cofactor biosynthesis protein YqeB [Thermodesulfobacteriota bacterium]
MNLAYRSKEMQKEIIVIRGGGDLGSGVAHRLHHGGFRVLILELAQPLAVRRTVAFARAVIDGQTEVEGITAVCVSSCAAALQAWAAGQLPVMVDPQMQILADLPPEVLIDATLTKRETGLRKDMAPLTIALGPGFEAGRHADIVIETNRGPGLGRLIFKGAAAPDTGIPAPVRGRGPERVLRAPCGGTVRHVLDIGAAASRGELICYVSNQPVTAPFNGIVRGLIMNGRAVAAGLKIGDIDPRQAKDSCYTISDKARALGDAALEAVEKNYAPL